MTVYVSAVKPEVDPAPLRIVQRPIIGEPSSATDLMVRVTSADLTAVRVVSLLRVTCLVLLEPSFPPLVKLVVSLVSKM